MIVALEALARCLTPCRPMVEGADTKQRNESQRVNYTRNLRALVTCFCNQERAGANRDIECLLVKISA